MGFSKNGSAQEIYRNCLRRQSLRWERRKICCPKTQTHRDNHQRHEIIFIEPANDPWSIWLAALLLRVGLWKQLHWRYEDIGQCQYASWVSRILQKKGQIRAPNRHDGREFNEKKRTSDRTNVKGDFNSNSNTEIWRLEIFGSWPLGFQRGYLRKKLYEAALHIKSLQSQAWLHEAWGILTDIESHAFIC